jgi:multisubunit Na+/H+ antiporter MnhE subunit
LPPALAGSFARHATGEQGVTTPAAGTRMRQQRAGPIARRAGAWLAWWVLLMSFWVVLDDSLEPDELLAGAGAAALGATLAELVGHQSGLRFRIRLRWIAPLLRLPGQVAAGTWTVFAALWLQLARGQEPRSGFRAVPVPAGGDSDEDRSRRVLLVWQRSVAPNSFALGIDTDADVMIVHQLVVPSPDQ